MSAANTLMGMKMGVVAAAYWGATGQQPTNSKTQMVNALARLVDSGQITLADVRRLGGATVPEQAIKAALGAPVPAFPAEAPAPSPLSKVNAASVQRVEAVESAFRQTAADLGTLQNTVGSVGRDVVVLEARINSQGRQQSSEVAALQGKVEAAAQAAAAEAKSLRAQVQGLADSVGQIKVDPAEVSKAVSQVVAEAFRPFAKRVEEVGAQAAVGQMVEAKVIDRRPALDVFGIDITDRQGQPVMVDIWDHADAPAVDPYYLWTRELLSSMLLTNKVWLGGPKGTGKTEAARQFAARTGRKVVRFNFRKFTTAEDYIGSTGLAQGNTVFAPGPVLAGMSTPGTVVLLDELTNIDPGEAAPLNGLLEPAGSVSLGGRSWSLAPGVMVVAADNTLGNGDDSGRYAGTRPMNSALVDRFELLVRMDYLPRDMEARALMTHTGCKQELAEHVIDAVRLCREKVGSGELVDAPSIRSCIAFVRALRLLSVPQAWASAIANRQPTEGAAALEALFTAAIDQTLVDSLI